MMSAGAGAPSVAHASRIVARTSSAVSGAPSSTRPSPSRRAARSRPAAAAIPASAAICARRMPASSAPLLLRRRPSKNPWSTSRRTPSARRRSATSTGNAAGTRAWVTPTWATARDSTSRSASARDMPPSTRSSSPRSLPSISSASGRTAAMRSRSSALVRTTVRPSCSITRNGSPIATGISWRISGERAVSPCSRTSVMPSACQVAGRRRRVGAVVIRCLPVRLDRVCPLAA